jgi:hypothetical protein
MSAAEPKRPSHNVYATLESESRNADAKDKWIKVGAGWLNSDNSISCVLDCWPLAWGAGYRGKFKLVVQEARDPEDRNQRRDSRDSRDRGRR